MPTDRELLERVKVLVKINEIDEARDILDEMADRSPTALRWLDELDQRYPRAPKLFESNSHDKRLLQAQDLLQQEKYQEARWLLVQIRHIPQAKAWLTELDDLQDRKRRHRKIERMKAAYQPNSPFQKLGDFVRSSSYASAIGGVLIFVGIGTILLWMFAPWLDGAGLFTGTEATCTAPELMIGEETCQLLGYIDPDMLARNQTGLLAVRWIDRFVFVIPGAAITLVVIGWLYASRNVQPFWSFSIFLGASIVLAGFPFFWEEYSSREAADYDIIFQRIIESSYSTGEFKTIGIAALSFVMVTGFLATLDGMGLLGVPMAGDRLLNPDLVDPDSGEFAGAIFERRRQNQNRRR